MIVLKQILISAGVCEASRVFNSYCDDKRNNRNKEERNEEKQNNKNTCSLLFFSDLIRNNFIL